MSNLFCHKPGCHNLTEHAFGDYCSEHMVRIPEDNNPETEPLLEGQNVFNGPRIIPKLRTWFNE